jgi:hypothetical protein
MTGLELKVWLSVLTVFVFTPALLLALLRRWLTCDGEVPAATSWAKLFGSAFLAAIPIYAFFLYIGWNDKLYVAFTFRYAVIPTAASTLHGLVVLLLTRAVGWWIKPKVTSICGELCMQVYLASTCLWFVLFTKQIDLTAAAYQILK